MAKETDRLWVDSMPEAYERLLGPSVFEPFADDLARRVAAHAPRRILELAAGTGMLTRKLLGLCPEADIVATDLNKAMVELGRARAPGADWRQADAMNLPFERGEFDMVTCQFGVMFFPDKAGAFAEARRVLTPDGTLLVNTWGTIDTHDFALALQAGLHRAFPDDPPTFIESIPHGYADLDVIAADMAEGGLECTSAEALTLQGAAPSAADVAMGFCVGTPVRAEIEQRGADVAATAALVAKEMEARLGLGPVTSRMTAYIIEAHPIP